MKFPLITPVSIARPKPWTNYKPVDQEKEISKTTVEGTLLSCLLFSSCCLLLQTSHICVVSFFIHFFSFSYRLLLLGHRGLTKNKMQTAVINRWLKRRCLLITAVYIFFPSFFSSLNFLKLHRHFHMLWVEKTTNMYLTRLLGHLPGSELFTREDSLEKRVGVLDGRFWKWP